MPGIAAALRAGVRLRSRPPSLTRLPATADRRKAGARSLDRRTETGDPGRLERSLFASLRDHRADPGNAVRQWRHRGRHRPRLPVRALATACCIPAISSTCRWRSSSMSAPRAATAVGPDAAIMFRHDWRTLASLPPGRWLGRVVLLRSACRTDGTDRSGAGRRALPRSARRGDRSDQRMGRSHRPYRRARGDQPGGTRGRVAVPCSGGADRAPATARR